MIAWQVGGVKGTICRNEMYGEEGAKGVAREVLIL